MHETFEVVYENGLLRPLAPLPSSIQEHQRLTLTIETLRPADDWLADADSSISLDAVRQALAGMSGTLTQAVNSERAER